MEEVKNVRIILDQEDCITENCCCIKYFFKPFVSIIVRPSVKYIFKPIGNGIKRIYKGILYTSDSEFSIFICCGGSLND